MFFFFRKPTIEIVCYTDNKVAYDYYKIKHASKYTPKWFKDATSEYIDELHFHEPQSTIKRCHGIINLLTTGIVMPIWTDVNIYTDVQNNTVDVSVADVFTQVANHNPKQWNQYLNPDNYIHSKIVSPWALSTKEDVKFYWGTSYYNMQPNLKYYIPPAIVDFKYQKATHINMFIPRENQHTIIKAGFPLIQMIPLTDKRIVLKYEFVDQLKMQNEIQLKPHTFVDRYKTIVKLEKNKCPFSK